MGHILSDPVAELVQSADKRLRRRRGIAFMSRAAVVVAGIVCLEQILARVAPLPDTRWLQGGLLLIPFVVGSIAWLRRPDPRRVLLEAGSWTGAPAILLAARSPDGAARRLGPLLQHEARKASARALETAAPPLDVGRLPRLVPLLYLVAALLVVAPGRHLTEPTLSPELERAVHRHGRGAAQLARAPELGRDRSRAVQDALNELQADGLDEQAAREAYDELKRIVDEAGGDWEAWATAARRDPLLATFHAKLADGDRTGAAEALSDLLQRLRSGEISPHQVRGSARALAAAAAAAPSVCVREALAKAAESLAQGDGSGAGLATLMDRLRPPSRSLRQLQRVVVSLDGMLGRPGEKTDPSTTAPVSENPAPVPGGPPSPTNGETARVALDPLQRTILANYFAVASETK